MKNSILENNLSFFKQVLMFRGLNEDQIRTLMKIMHIRTVKQNEIIAKEGANEDSLFILLKGEVEITKSLLLPTITDMSGKQEKSLIILTEKQFPFFGEMALFDDLPERSASITALKQGTLVEIQKKDLLKILDKDTEIASILYKNIASVLTRRLIKSNIDIMKLTTAFSLALEG